MSFWINRAALDNLLYTFLMEGMSTGKSLMGGKNVGNASSCFFSSICAVLVYRPQLWKDCAGIQWLARHSLSFNCVSVKLWQSFSLYFDGSEVHKSFLLKQSYLVLCNTSSVFICSRKLSLWWCFKYKCKLVRFLIAVPFSFIKVCSMY